MCCEYRSYLVVFDMLRINIQATFYVITPLVQANVALERISDFLYNVSSYRTSS